MGWRAGSMCLLVAAGCTAPASDGDEATDDAAQTGGSTGSSLSGEPTSSEDGGGPTQQCEDDSWEQGDDGAEESGFGMGDDMPMSVYAVQQGEAPFNVRIVLSDVIVTSPAAQSEVLNGVELFVQELAGGPYSGLRIQTSAFDLGALLVPGDTAEIRGIVQQYGDYYLLAVSSSDDVVATGTATPPDPPVVTVDELAAQQPSARPYEGVIVRVEMAMVTDTDPCDGEFMLDDTVRVDDRFMPDAMPEPSSGQVFNAVEGVFIFASSSYELAPPDPSAIE